MGNAIACQRCDAPPTPAERWRSHRVTKRGSFRRKHDGKVVYRYYCSGCRKTFSNSTGSVTFGQHKPQLNVPIAIELSCSTAQRRIALKLGINRKTVAKKLMFLGGRARIAHQTWLAARPEPITTVQFDDMETSEHTKLKPLSIPMIVESKSRFILAWDVAIMPAKGHLAALSRRRYGRRRDERQAAWHRTLSAIAPYAIPDINITSDQNPHYPAAISRVFPLARHQTVKGRAACTAGQGEMKKGGRDPLFWFNHTAAMVRDNVKRLTRRTWCSTKRYQRLNDHLAIYATFHNLILLRRKSRAPLTSKDYRLAAIELIGS